MELKNKEIRIETTNYCNSKCVICPREKMTRAKTTMPMMHFRTLVDQAMELKADTISLFGYGEPLLDTTLAEKIDYCDNNELKTFITSNASLLTVHKAIEILQAGLQQIRFSVHGFGENYEKVHCGLKYDTVIQNIKNFITINHELFSDRCRIDVSVIPMHGEQVDDIVRFWSGYADYLEIWRPHNWTDGRTYREVSRKKKTCGRPFSGPVQINADGTMMVCCFDYDSKMTIGNTYHNTIEQILTGEKMNRIRRCHMDGDLKGLPCEHCDQLNIEDESPLLYSTIDVRKGLNKSYSGKKEMVA